MSRSNADVQYSKNEGKKRIIFVTDTWYYLCFSPKNRTPEDGLTQTIVIPVYQGL